MWIAMFTSYAQGERQDTPIVTAAGPQEAIDAAKERLTSQEYDPWTEVWDAGVNRKILVREIQRSKPKEPVFEYGWVHAMSVFEVGQPYRSPETALDEKAEVR